MSLNRYNRKVNKHSKFVYTFTKHSMVLMKFLNPVANKTKVKDPCVGKNQKKNLFEWNIEETHRISLWIKNSSILV